VALNHLVVFIIGRVYIERLTWDEFMEDPTHASEIVKEAGWDWDELQAIADSVQDEGWRQAEERLKAIWCKARQERQG
jgi:hypothetical protein